MTAIEVALGAKIAVETIRSTPTTVERVRLVAFDQPTRTCLEPRSGI